MQAVSECFDFANFNLADHKAIKADGCCDTHGKWFGDECESCAIERERQIRIMFSKCEAMGLAPSYHCLKLADYWQKTSGQIKLTAAAMDMLDGKLQGLMLVGSDSCFGTGTGKTTLAATILFEDFLQNRRVGLYTTAASILRTNKDIISKNIDGSSTAFFDGLMKPALLVIDELMAQAPTKYEMDFLNELVARRLEFGKKIVLISNKPGDDMKRLFNFRVHSRFNANGRKIVCDWGDARCGEMHA